MRRWHEETALMIRRMKMEREKHGVDPDETDPSICHCLKGIGFMRKQRPYSCGRPRCLLCHYEKYLEPRRAREKRAWRREVEAQIHDS